MQQLADGESVAWTVIAHRGHERSWWDGAGVETNTSSLGAPVQALIMIQPAPVTGSFPNAPSCLAYCHYANRIYGAYDTNLRPSMQNLVPVFSSREITGNVSAHTPSTIHEFSHHSYFTGV